MTKRTTKSRSRKRRTTSSRNSRRVHAPGWARWVAFLLITTFLTIGCYQVDGLVFKALYRWVAHRPTAGDFAGNQLREVINDFHSIGDNDLNEERVLESLSDPVVWYNKQYSHARFPTGSSYDQFEFVNPLQYDGASDRRNNNYEIRFDGAYRFRHPKKDLLKFESGVAIIRNGLITSLKTTEKPNAYTAKWINWVFRHYFLACLLTSGVLTILFFALSPDKLSDLIFRIGRWFFGRLVG